ncbi:hypothetical protein LOTGIDRAFT_110314 [Lottia gigantea]|uniref:Major facilitator superfamily associated domain-containing protein n=1 Tax=Lottia gigantea TaxID=225164 RepID=V4B151_LOTGI|nr:hypothetical protein LOTGIDRAFT_110314 [Lottia gigantea]ESP04018.1 hypothetical protein LOTGIDRAFT_110314 [Lottia gigantea]
MLAYCACTLGFTMLSSVFSFYYVKVFLNYFMIEESWFQFAQLLYLTWNTINDPLFAYVQDTTNFSFTKTRRESILYTAPLFSLSFLITWFPWAKGTWVTGLHLITALCLYDTMFTYIGLAYCCLFTEISTDSKVRLQLTQWSQIARLIGSSSIFICEFTSESLKSFSSFQYTCIGIGIIAALFMTYAGLYAHTEHDVKLKKNSSDQHAMHDKSLDKSMWRLTWQVLTDRNFLSFVIANFCQLFQRTFMGNFVAIICDELIPDEFLSPSWRKVFYGSFNFLNTLLVIVGVPLIQSIGYASVIKWSFIWKIGAGIFMLFLGKEYLSIMMLYILFDQIFAGAAFALFGLPLSDIADHDKNKYKRSHPISSIIYGTNALVTKPAQSLSPMLTVAILNRYGYKEHTAGTLPEEGALMLKDAIFVLMCIYSITLGIIQILSWSMFVIRPKSKKEIEIELTI